jgi:hypothetical protein
LSKFLDVAVKVCSKLKDQVAKRSPGLRANSIGDYIGKTEPTITTGNYFAWEAKNNKNDYFIDSTTGEIVSSSK